jgi:hypothetical protein
MGREERSSDVLPPRSGNTMKPMPNFFLLILAAVPAVAAGAPSDRMARVEHGLRPAVTIEGDTPWTLEERMRFYEVPAVSGLRLLLPPSSPVERFRRGPSSS